MNTIDVNYKTNSRYFSKKNFKATNDTALINSDTKNTSDNKVLATSIATSLGTILLTLKGLSKLPSHKKAKGMFNLHLRELDILSLGLATVTGACIGGCLVDKPEHKKAKFREASHQAVANIAIPLFTISVFNTIGDKLNIKIPKIKSNNKLAKATNVFTEILPNLVTSCAGLWTGIQIGNKISNKITDKTFGQTKDKRKVRLLDYCVHIDDPITIITLADKTGKIKAFTSKTMPFTFILSGYQAGMAKAPHLERENTSTDKSL